MQASNGHPSSPLTTSEMHAVRKQATWYLRQTGATVSERSASTMLWESCASVMVTEEGVPWG